MHDRSSIVLADDFMAKHRSEWIVRMKTEGVGRHSEAVGGRYLAAVGVGNENNNVCLMVVIWSEESHQM